MVVSSVPNWSASISTSLRSSSGVEREGRKMFKTLSGPMASTQSFVTKAESMPPLNPTTTPRHPDSSTLLLMKSMMTSSASAFSWGRMMTGRLNGVVISC